MSTPDVDPVKNALLALQDSICAKLAAIDGG
ncbi:MAG: coproporphyrinogen oxidase, partial [Kosakonia cowanii]|nr:coproporphyrinogen oxidase [Kosakonia cowanii]